MFFSFALFLFCRQGVSFDLMLLLLLDPQSVLSSFHGAHYKIGINCKDLTVDDNNLPSINSLYDYFAVLFIAVCLSMSPPHLSRLTLFLFLFHIVNRHRFYCRRCRSPLFSSFTREFSLSLCMCACERLQQLLFHLFTALSSILMPESFVVRLQ